jgi:hypothetical protein
MSDNKNVFFDARESQPGQNVQSGLRSHRPALGSRFKALALAARAGGRMDSERVGGRKNKQYVAQGFGNLYDALDNFAMSQRTCGGGRCGGVADFLHHSLAKFISTYNFSVMNDALKPAIKSAMAPGVPMSVPDKLKKYATYAGKAAYYAGSFSWSCLKKGMTPLAAAKGVAGGVIAGATVAWATSWLWVAEDACPRPGAGPAEQDKGVRARLLNAARGAGQKIMVRLLDSNMLWALTHVVRDFLVREFHVDKGILNVDALLENLFDVPGNRRLFIDFLTGAHPESLKPLFIAAAHAISPAEVAKAQAAMFAAIGSRTK